MLEKFSLNLAVKGRMSLPKSWNQELSFSKWVYWALILEKNSESNYLSFAKLIKSELRDAEIGKHQSQTMLMLRFINDDFHPSDIDINKDDQ